MRFTFNLTPDSDQNFEFFPSAVAAFRIPERLDNTLSLLVWGATIFQPENFPEFCRLLPEEVRNSLPTALFLSGWGTLTYNETRSGKVILGPYAPSLSMQEYRLLYGSDGKPVVLTRIWEGSQSLSSPEYVFEFVLEQPLGHLTLRINAAGPVTLSLDPSDCVPVKQVESLPQKYVHDLTRTRQLQTDIS